MLLPRAELANLVTPAITAVVAAVDISEPDVLQVFECDRLSARQFAGHLRIF